MAQRVESQSLSRDFDGLIILMASQLFSRRGPQTCYRKVAGKLVRMTPNYWNLNRWYPSRIYSPSHSQFPDLSVLHRLVTVAQRARIEDSPHPIIDVPWLATSQ